MCSRGIVRLASGGGGSRGLGSGRRVRHTSRPHGRAVAVAASAPAPAPGGAAAAAGGGARPPPGKLVRALCEVIAWPSARQVAARTALTVGLVTALCVVVSAVDACLVALLVATRGGAAREGGVDARGRPPREQAATERGQGRAQ